MIWLILVAFDLLVVHELGEGDGVEQGGLLGLCLGRHDNDLLGVLAGGLRHVVLVVVVGPLAEGEAHGAHSHGERLLGCQSARVEIIGVDEIANAAALDVGDGLLVFVPGLDGIEEVNVIEDGGGLVQ